MQTPRIEVWCEISKLDQKVIYQDWYFRFVVNHNGPDGEEEVMFRSTTPFSSTSECNGMIGNVREFCRANKTFNWKVVDDGVHGVYGRAEWHFGRRHLCTLETKRFPTLREFEWNFEYLAGSFVDAPMYVVEAVVYQGTEEAAPKKI